MYIKKFDDAIASSIYMAYCQKEEQYQSALNYVHYELKRKRIEMKESDYVRDPFVFIERRIKDFDSAISKYGSRCEGKSPQTITDVEHCVRDIAGMRIVCPYLDDVYIVEQIIRLMPDVMILEEERDDYIENPKPTGYSSLHLTLKVKNVFVEVQIRSMLMHSWSRLEHYLRYKNNEPKKSTIKMLEYLAKMFRSVDKLLIVLRDHGNDEDEQIITEAISDIEKIKNSLDD